jgi:hypothetical protein
MSYVSAVMTPRTTLSNVPAAEESVLGSNRNLEYGNASTNVSVNEMTMMHSLKGFPMNSK